MKWAKHLTDCLHQNRALMQLVEECGAEGYGRYWMCFEAIIAGLEEVEDDPGATFSVKQWAKILHTKFHNVLSFFAKLSSLGLLSFFVAGQQVLGSFAEASVQERKSNAVCASTLVTVELRNCRKLLSINAISSARRSHAGDPVATLEEKRVDSKDKASSQKNQKKKLEQYDPNRGQVKTVIAPLQYSGNSDIADMALAVAGVKS